MFLDDQLESIDISFCDHYLGALEALQLKSLPEDLAAFIESIFLVLYWSLGASAWSLPGYPLASLLEVRIPSSSHSMCRYRCRSANGTYACVCGYSVRMNRSLSSRSPTSLAGTRDSCCQDMDPGSDLGPRYSTCLMISFLDPWTRLCPFETPTATLSLGCSSLWFIVLSFCHPRRKILVSCLSENGLESEFLFIKLANLRKNSCVESFRSYRCEAI